MHFNRTICVVVAAIAATFVSPAPFETHASERFASEPSAAAAQQCAGSIDVPVRLALVAQENAGVPGAELVVEAEIAAHANLEALSLSLETADGMDLLGSASHYLAALPQGESWVVEIPVRLPLEGEGSITVKLLAEGLGGVQYEKNEGFYAIAEAGHVMTGDGSYLRVKLLDIETRYEDGVMTAEAATEAHRDAVVLDGNSDDIPEPQLRLSAEDEALSVGLLPMAAEEDIAVGLRTTAQVEVAAAVAGNITVQGTVRWLDENGTLHPVFGMTVQVRDDELIGSELVTQAATGVDGTYFFVVDNDDGIGAGDRDIFVRFRTTNSAVAIENAGILGAPYEADTAVQDEVPDSTVITENFSCANTGTGPSCGLLTGASYVASYASSLNGDTFLNHLVLEWPGTTGSANYDGSDINLRPGDQWDWDVMFHEYGHYVMDTFNFEDNPGGPHNIGDCISDVQGSKSNGVRLAWGEGWPTFFGTAGQLTYNLASLNVPRVGDVLYADTGESNFSYSLETQDNNGLGEDNEVAVQRILWDLWDIPADSRDTATESDQMLFDRVNAADPTTLSGAWAALRAPLSDADDLAYGGVAADHEVGPDLNSPASGSIQGPGASFSWDREVGCSTTFDGDSFDLVFYNANTLAQVQTFAGLASPSKTLSLAEYNGLRGASGTLRWAVEGRNGANPATGPYLGENFNVTLNQPPVANAGPDVLAECTSPTGALVGLNGTGSSDPDGDSLGYAWSAPGIVFNNPASATPNATFPEATKLVTLIVTDSIQNDSDTMSVTVEDSTPPALICPAPLVAECTTFGGTPKTNSEVQAFLAAASATDVCDPNPVLINDAPPFFGLGATPVEFTATDNDANASMCVAPVTVVDTTPPVIVCPGDITIECSEWNGVPADHPEVVAFLAAVSATDICDPAPALANDGPGFYGLGTTDVTFTATDGEGNAAQCVASIEVVDTTPPEISASLAPGALWPPNHKLRGIAATVIVTDICDPSPTFVLTSATSDEPDNAIGNGDGNTVGDIQGADVGTSDVAFQLRAERAGTGDGRTYTALYTGMDLSGNTADASDTVEVPHNP